MKRKFCSKCLGFLPIDQFTPHKGGADGLHPYCKKCRREYRKRRYLENPEYDKNYTRMMLEKHPDILRERVRNWNQKNPGASRAHDAVCWAVKKGVLKKPSSCEMCGVEKKLHAHHHKGYDESNKLDVQWLCPTCHKAVDMQKYLTT